MMQEQTHKIYLEHNREKSTAHTANAGSSPCLTWSQFPLLTGTLCSGGQGVSKAIHSEPFLGSRVNSHQDRLQGVQQHFSAWCLERVERGRTCLAVATEEIQMQPFRERNKTTNSQYTLSVVQVSRSPCYGVKLFQERARERSPSPPQSWQYLTIQHFANNVYELTSNT